jgi:hypothetical protein
MARSFYLVEAKDARGSFVSTGLVYESKERAKAVADLKGKDERGEKLGKISNISIIWEER